MTRYIDQAAYDRRERARVKGRFGVQDHTAPESVLEQPAAISAETAFEQAATRKSPHSVWDRQGMRPLAGPALVSICEEEGFRLVELRWTGGTPKLSRAYDRQGATDFTRDVAERIEAVFHSAARTPAEADDIPALTRFGVDLDERWVFHPAAYDAHRERTGAPGGQL